MLKLSNESFGKEEADRARIELRKAIADTRTILGSPLLQGIMNLRDKHLAHSLSQTRREKIGPVGAMKFRDEGEVLNATVAIVEALHCWVYGSSFSLEDSREIDRQNAEALWKACTFNIAT